MSTPKKETDEHSVIPSSGLSVHSVIPRSEPEASDEGSALSASGWRRNEVSHLTSKLPWSNNE
jgi:hypothetical protein